MVTGTAEFGSLVTIRGGQAEVQTTADPYTAKFSAKVMLAEGDNTLSVTATDVAGNESLPTDASVNYIVPPGPPATVMIEGPESARAGEPVEFKVTVLNVLGDVIDSPSFTLSTDAPAGSTTFGAPSTYTFCDVGTWTVTAEAGAGGPSASVEIDISLGKPAALTLTTAPSPVAIAAGATVTYSTETMDTCGNVTADFVSVTTNAPGAVAAAGTVSGLVRAGSWVLVAEVPGTGLVDTATMLVDADASSTVVVVTLTAHAGFVGVPIGYTVTAVDGFGNPVPTPPVITVPTDAGATIDTTTQTITFSAAGTHTVTATVGAASDSDFVIVTDPDMSAPTVAITSPVGGTVFSSGSIIKVTVSATDDQGLAQIFLQGSGVTARFLSQIVPLDPISGAAPKAFVATFLFDVGGNSRFGDLTLVAQAMDTTGNLMSSAEVTVRVDPAQNLGTAAGFTVVTITAKGTLNGPRGLTTDAAGQIYVANNGEGASVVQVDPASGVQSIFTPTISGIPTSEDIAFYAPDGTYFLTISGGPDQVEILDSVGNPADFDTGFGSRPEGIIIESGTSVTALWEDGLIRRFDPSAPPPVSPSFTMDANNPLNGNAYGIAQVGSGFVGTDRGNDELWYFDPPAASLGNVLNRFRVDHGNLNQPRDVVLSPAGGRIYVADEKNGLIVQFDISTCLGTSNCPSKTIVSNLDRPWGLHFTAAGDLLVTDENADVLYRVSGPF